MTFEKSCGAVVFTRIRGEIRYILAQAIGGHFGFPKGHMEPGETEEETALREIFEEVRIRPMLLDGFREISEYYIPDVDVQKQVVFFLAEYADQEIVFQKEELQNAPLVPYDAAMELLTHAESKRILTAAHNFLSREEENTTLNWYHENADVFITRTSGVDMSALYDVFLAYVAPGGKIMDLGCGAGKASRYFVQHGFDAVPIDGCRELCDAATKLTGCPSRNILFAQLDYSCEFDGIWACASLLHVPKGEMAQILTLVKNALKTGGIFYASYKYGTEERIRNGRLFSDYTEDTLKALIAEVGGFEILQLWLTDDARPDRAEERWVNVICRKENE